MGERVFYGGQALIEGVMMRGRAGFALALRRPDGSILSRSIPRPGPAGPGTLQPPFLRGIRLLWEMLAVGTWALAYSANAQTTPVDQEIPEPTRATMSGTLVVALALGIGIFFVLPLAASSRLEHLIGSSLVANLADGVLRLILIVGYLWLIGRMAEVRRLFAYHGAEHKVINAFEAGASLTPAAVRSFPLTHPRCGTGFLLVVAALAIVIFPLLGSPPWPVRLAGRILLLPVIAALAYELLRLAARNYERAWVRALLAPALALQQLTTREPDDEQIEVAIVALERVLADERAAGEAAPSADALPT
jgi:uncharacterized protein YqhQ